MRAAASLEGKPVVLNFVEFTPYIGGQIERYTASGSSTTDGVDYYFDSNANRIVRKDDFSRLPGKSTISLQRARKSAEAFGRKNVPFFRQRGMTLMSSVGVGGTKRTPSRYSFYWVKKDTQSGAILPTFFSADVDAIDGKVRSFSSADASVTVSTVPKISRADAIALVRKGLSAALVKRVPTVDLYVGTDPIGDPGGRQTLLWAVDVSKTDSTGILIGGRIFVDAMTGRIISVEPLK